MRIEKRRNFILLNKMHTPAICIPATVIEKEIANSLSVGTSVIESSQLPLEYKYNIMQAYDYVDNYSLIELNEKVALLSKTKKTYSNLVSVLYSNRYPYTIMLIAANIGMYIPGSKRYGIATFDFYLSNVKYYETLIARTHIPSLKDIYLNDNKYEFLLTLKDDQILIQNYIYSINYSDRKTMIKNFIKTNIDIYGYFSLPSNTRSFYNSDGISIFYSVSNNANQIYKESYTTTGFLHLIDEVNKCVYTNENHQIKFNNLCLLGLRKLITEKLIKWRCRDNSDEIGSTKLYKILEKLDIVLENETRVNSKLFFKTYTISTTS